MACKQLNPLKTPTWLSNQIRAFQLAGNELAIAIPIKISQCRVVKLMHLSRQYFTLGQDGSQFTLY